MNTRRDLGVDAVRGLAMVLMTATHALRALRPSNVPEFGQWLWRIEPVTPALFFLLAGWGLARSFRNTSDPTRWRLRQLKRAGLIYLLSSAIFFVYSGPQWPESLVSTGVLGCLAWTIATGTLLLPRTSVAIGLLVGCVSLRWWMDLHGIQIDGLNAGTFSFFPNLPIFLCGLLGERLIRGHRTAEAVLGTCGAILVLILSWKVGFRQLWDEWGTAKSVQEYLVSIHHQSNGFAMVRDYLMGIPSRPMFARFTTPKLVLLPVLVTLAALAAQFICMVTDRFPQRMSLLAALGRHGLAYYLGHFVCLGALSVALPTTMVRQSWTWLLATLAIALGAALLSRHLDSRRGMP